MYLSDKQRFRLHAKCPVLKGVYHNSSAFCQSIEDILSVSRKISRFVAFLSSKDLLDGLYNEDYRSGCSDNYP